ncbi:MAG: YaeQ family protein [Polyangiaceae bacterium]
MALGATMYRFQVSLSDVDGGVYESLDLRLARHPSESARYLLLRTLVYCLSYEDGIAFSKGGLSSTEEAAVSVRDRTGALQHCIEIGSPSAERLHRASKSAPRVSLFSAAELKLLRREAASREIHRLEQIALYRPTPAFLDAFEAVLDRNLQFELVRNAAVVYVSLASARFETPLEQESLVEA